ncbi:MAG: 6-carboxytetrahydropterin synthase QueD [Candidatus Omnitrophota bacterium]
MYEIKVSGQFSAAHALKGYKGKCENLHGHNWKVQVAASAAGLDNVGMVLDFSDVRKKLNSVLKQMDHKYLNRIPYFSAAGGSASGGKKTNPTSENIAKFIYNKLSVCLKKSNVELTKVSVWETDNSCASYSE